MQDKYVDVAGVVGATVDLMMKSISVQAASGLLRSENPLPLPERDVWEVRTSDGYLRVTVERGTIQQGR